MSEYFPSDDIKDAMRDLRAARTDAFSTGEHLDHDRIAAIADGRGIDTDASAHLSECAECRERLTAVTHLLDDPEVRAAFPQRAPAARKWTATRWIGAAGIAAAAVFMIAIVTTDRVPALNESALEPHREGALTATAPPRILSRSSDALRWSSVREADLYQVQVWNREGTVVWSAETRDTSVAIPDSVLASGASYLWEVKARTGWDRWVSSDFVELEVTPESRR